MPIRSTRARKNDGLKKYISMLYEKPALKFLKGGEPWEPLADLIFGPDQLYLSKFFDESVRQRSRDKLEALKGLWSELRDDIIAAQQQYQPNKKPWGWRFEKRG